eukprot:111190_1
MSNFLRFVVDSSTFSSNVVSKSKSCSASICSYLLFFFSARIIYVSLMHIIWSIMIVITKSRQFICIDFAHVATRIFGERREEISIYNVLWLISMKLQDVVIISRLECDLK